MRPCASPRMLPEDDLHRAGAPRPRLVCTSGVGATCRTASARARFRPGQVIFGKRRAYQRKVAVAEIDGDCVRRIYVLRAKDRTPFCRSSCRFS